MEAGDIFVTREGDSGDLQDFTRLVGFTVSPLSRYHVHFVKYPTKADGGFKPTRIRFTGMDGYAHTSKTKSIEFDHSFFNP